MNSPTNLAGETGSVVIPTGLPSYGGWGLPLGLVLVAVGALSLGERRRRRGSPASGS